MRPVTVQRVADEAGVSKMTASLALRGKVGGEGSVSRATAERVLQAAVKLGYQPNQTRGRNATFAGMELKHEPCEKDVALARFYCRQWMCKGIEHEELFGEAMVALMRACVTFDEGKGAAFGTHLMWVVRSRLRVKFGHPYHKRNTHGVVFVSLDAPVSETDDTSFADLIVDESSRTDLGSGLDDLLQLCSDRSARVLEARYLECLSQRQTAYYLACTVNEVRNAESEGLETLRNELGVLLL
jgi:RNA polymerase sigma factor (sigma-70 family)